MSGPACPLCASPVDKRFVREYGTYTLWECPACGAGFCDPFKNPGPEYYEHKADIYARDVEETTDPMSFEYDEGLALLRRELPSGARVLDVGCGAGGFLHRLKAAGFDASGADFSARRAAALRQKGFNICEGGMIECAKKGPAPFDALTLFQVLEHVDAPAAWLAAAKSLLKPGGLFVLATPNRERRFDHLGSEMQDVDNPPHHLTRWNGAALKNLLIKNGFVVAECRALGYPLPLLQLMTRNILRFGLAQKTLNAPPPPPTASGAPAAPDSKRGFIRSLVEAKSAVLDGGAKAAYPLFRLMSGAFDWQGPVLFAAARAPR